MFPELERIIKDLGAVESLLNEMQQQQSIRPEAFAALTQRVMALGSAVQEVATSPLVQEDSNATAFKEFTVRFKECLAKLQALKSKIDMSAKAQPAVASKTPDSSDPASANAKPKRKIFRMRGYLKKRGVTGLTKWRRRYFKRDGDKLFYFIDQEDLKPRGSIDLLQMTGVEFAHDDEGQHDDEGSLRFTIYTPERTFELEADSSALAHLWVKSLSEWKMRVSTVRGVEEEAPGTNVQSSLLSEYAQYEKVWASGDDKISGLTSELELRRQEKLKREEQKTLERQQREEERLKREQEPSIPVRQVSPPVLEAVSDEASSSPSPSPSASLSISSGSIAVAPARPSVPPPPSVEEERANKEEQLKANLAMLAEKHIKLSAQLSSLVAERQRLVKVGETLLDDDASLQKLLVEFQELSMEELYLNNACEWGFRRVRAQEQLQYTLLGSLLVVSSRQLGQRVQVRYAQRVREETVRHQAGAQSVRVTALKEAWEKMGEGERGEDVWRKRAEKEKMAYEAHKVQSELLNHDKANLMRALDEAIAQASSSSERSLSLLASSRAKLHRLREYAAEMPEGEKGGQPLTRQISDLKKSYFYSLALSVKLSLSQLRDGSVPPLLLEALWAQCSASEVPWQEWPRWLTQRVTEQQRQTVPEEITALVEMSKERDIEKEKEEKEKAEREKEEKEKKEKQEKQAASAKASLDSLPPVAAQPERHTEKRKVRKPRIVAIE